MTEKEATVASAMEKLRLAVKDVQLAHELLNMRVDIMEQTIKEARERERKQQEQFEQMLALVREIKVELQTSRKLFNLITRFVSFASGLGVAIAGIWWSRNG